jgi:photosystem II stability/assembly factor-like uncharacterized protein
MMRLLAHYVLALLLQLPVAAFAEKQASLPDLLDLPAVASARSLDSLMLDVTRAGKRLIAVGAYGAILFSDDGGANWQQASVPVQVTLTAVTFPSPKKGWAVGHDTVILHSSDGGETWTRQLDGRSTGEILLAGAEARMAELDAQEEPDMMALDMVDMALVEAEREQEVGPNRPLLDVWFGDEDYGIAVGAFNYFFVTEDGGETWQDHSLSLPNPESLHLYSIHPVEEGVLLIVGEFALVLRSRDNGSNWEQLSLDYEGSLFAVNGGGGQAWIAGLRGNGFFSPDAGDSWQALSLGTEATLLGVTSPARDVAIFSGLQGTLLRYEQGSGQVSNIVEPGGAHIASVITLEDSIVTAGAGGLQKFGRDGASLPVTYSDGE